MNACPARAAPTFALGSGQTDAVASDGGRINFFGVASTRPTSGCAGVLAQTRISYSHETRVVKDGRSADCSSDGC